MVRRGTMIMVQLIKETTLLDNSSLVIMKTESINHINIIIMRDMIIRTDTMNTMKADLQEEGATKIEEEKGEDSQFVEEGEQEVAWEKNHSKESISMMTLNNILHQEGTTGERESTEMMMTTDLLLEEEAMMLQIGVEEAEGLPEAEEVPHKDTKMMKVNIVAA
jgi:hypothetical protein